MILKNMTDKNASNNKPYTREKLIYKRFVSRFSPTSVEEYVPGRRRYEGLFVIREVDSWDKYLGEIYIVVDASSSFDEKKLSSVIHYIYKLLVRERVDVKWNIIIFATKAELIRRVKIKNAETVCEIINENRDKVGSTAEFAPVESILRKNFGNITGIIFVSDYDFTEEDRKNFYQFVLKKSLAGVKVPMLVIEVGGDVQEEVIQTFSKKSHIDLCIFNY